MLSLLGPESGRERNERSAACRACAHRHDVNAALEAARKAEEIIAAREQQADRDSGLASDDVMRRREAEARQEASARASAVRQDPAPSRHARSPEHEPELEAGL